MESSTARPVIRVRSFGALRNMPTASSDSDPPTSDDLLSRPRDDYFNPPNDNEAINPPIHPLGLKNQINIAFNGLTYNSDSLLPENCPPASLPTRPAPIPAKSSQLRNRLVNSDENTSETVNLIRGGASTLSRLSNGTSNPRIQLAAPMTSVIQNPPAPYSGASKNIPVLCTNISLESLNNQPELSFEPSESFIIRDASSLGISVTPGTPHNPTPPRRSTATLKRTVLGSPERQHTPNLVKQLNEPHRFSILSHNLRGQTSAGQPRAQTSVGQPRAQTSVGQPRAQTSLGQPRAQTSVVQPRAQTSAGQPRAQTSVGQSRVQTTVGQHLDGPQRAPTIVQYQRPQVSLLKPQQGVQNQFVRQVGNKLVLGRTSASAPPVSQSQTIIINQQNPIVAQNANGRTIVITGPNPQRAFSQQAPNIGQPRFNVPTSQSYTPQPPPFFVQSPVHPTQRLDSQAAPNITILPNLYPQTTTVPVVSRANFVTTNPSPSYLFVDDNLSATHYMQSLRDSVQANLCRNDDVQVLDNHEPTTSAQNMDDNPRLQPQIRVYSNIKAAPIPPPSYSNNTPGYARKSSDLFISKKTGRHSCTIIMKGDFTAYGHQLRGCYVRLEHLNKRQIEMKKRQLKEFVVRRKSFKPTKPVNIADSNEQGARRDVRSVPTPPTHNSIQIQSPGTSMSTKLPVVPPVTLSIASNVVKRERRESSDEVGADPSNTARGSCTYSVVSASQSTSNARAASPSTTVRQPVNREGSLNTCDKCKIVTKNDELWRNCDTHSTLCISCLRGEPRQEKRSLKEIMEKLRGLTKDLASGKSDEETQKLTNGVRKRAKIVLRNIAELSNSDNEEKPPRKRTRTRRQRYGSEN